MADMTSATVETDDISATVTVVVPSEIAKPSAKLLAAPSVSAIVYIADLPATALTEVTDPPVASFAPPTSALWLAPEFIAFAELLSSVNDA
jgi:hypothetical protein